MVNASATAALRQGLESEAGRLGFASIGVARATLPTRAGAALAGWLQDGAHGTMDWMLQRSNQRASPDALWSEARSAISLGVSYAPADDPRTLLGHADRGNISIYARDRDYHDFVKKALKELARWLVVEARARGLGEIGVKVFVDTAPVLEKPVAQQAGLGWQGKHTNLVSRKHGSWLMLGEILTTLELPYDDPADDTCGSCRACQHACPTDAFPAPYRLDARRCISYLTIEHKGPIPEDLRKQIGNRIYGCDDCLAACPWNKFAVSAHAHRAFQSRAELAAPRLSDLLMLDDAGFRKLFSGSPIKRVGRNRFVRNCLIAAGNSGDPRLLDQIEPLRDDPDPVVAEAATWASNALRQVP